MTSSGLDCDLVRGQKLTSSERLTRWASDEVKNPVKPHLVTSSDPPDEVTSSPPYRGDEVEVETRRP